MDGKASQVVVGPHRISVTIFGSGRAGRGHRAGVRGQRAVLARYRRDARTTDHGGDLRSGTLRRKQSRDGPQDAAGDCQGSAWRPGRHQRGTSHRPGRPFAGWRMRPRVHRALRGGSRRDGAGRLQSRGAGGSPARIPFLADQAGRGGDGTRSDGRPQEGPRRRRPAVHRAGVPVEQGTDGGGPGPGRGSAGEQAPRRPDARSGWRRHGSGGLAPLAWPARRAGPALGQQPAHRHASARPLHSQKRARSGHRRDSRRPA